ncbi:MAG: integration host factor subunit alpha [Candidatus Thorarchaeota archaeon]
MTLTKAHLVDRIHDATSISRSKSAKLIDSIFEIMKQTLEGGEDILISGFGKFCVKEKNSRRGRNPQTGNDLILGARRVVIFKCSGVLGDKINGSG